jgi:ligand-binding sensor domain-containing protein/signal transduction histidine kinase
LVHNDVRTIYQTTDGILWFGTAGGVSRYNGKEFVDLTEEDGLSHNHIHAICQTSDDMLWFATHGDGVFGYDGKEIIQRLTEKNGLVDNHVHSICATPDNKLWFGTEGGVSVYDGSRFIAHCTGKDGLVGTPVVAICQDSDGMMWFSAPAGASRYDEKTVVNFTTADGLKHNSVATIYPAPDGKIWFGTNGGGVSTYDGKGFVSFTTVDGLASNWIHDIYQAQEGAIWFGTSDGASRYDLQPVPVTDGSRFINFTTQEGLTNNTVRAIQHDAEGKIWFGTDSGVSQYDPMHHAGGRPFAHLTTQDGLVNDTVRVIHRRFDGTMWLGTDGGVSAYNGEQFFNLTTRDGLVDNRVHAICDRSDGTLWFGTYGGVSRYHLTAREDENRFVNFTSAEGLPSHFVYDLLPAPGDVIWFGTYGGVSRYNTSSPSDGTPFVNFTIKDGLVDNEVNDLHRSADGTMWFGTDGGVSIYDGVVWGSLDTWEGLVGANVTTIHEDANGFLWFGTTQGITRYRRNTVPSTVRIIAVNVASMGADKRYKPAEKSPSITAGSYVTIEYQAIDFKTHPQKRQYRYRIREIDGHEPAIARPYFPPTKERTFAWTPQKAGVYIFEVQAIDRDLNNSAPASVTLKIVPQWYLNGWIAIPSVIAITGFIVLFVVFTGRYYAKRHEAQRLREEMLQQEQSAREQAEGNANTLRSLAHAVKKPLAIIEACSENLAMLEEAVPAETHSKDTTSKFLRQIGKQVNHARQTVNQLLEATAQPEFRLFDLRLEIEVLLHETLQKNPDWEHKITLTKQCEAIPHINGDADKLRMAFENLFINACEAMEETGGTLTLRMTRTVDAVRIDIQDNGCGIDAEALQNVFKPLYSTKKDKGGTGLGTWIAKQIIVEHRGQIDIQSKPGVGTTIYIELPIFFLRQRQDL